MALSTSILAYNDCKDFLEKAVDDSKGARLPFRNETDANYYRMRCNQFRKLDRIQNAMIYDIGAKMHGHSEYDQLTLTIKQSSDGYFWVYAQKLLLNIEEVEALSEVEDTSYQLDASEMQFLEDHSNDDKDAT